MLRSGLTLTGRERAEGASSFSKFNQASGVKFWGQQAQGGAARKKDLTRFFSRYILVIAKRLKEITRDNRCRTLQGPLR